MPAKPTIGFIGLGLMGQAFTRRLVSCGYTVTGFDIAAAKAEQAKKHGVIAAMSSADVTSNSDFVLMCVVSTDAVHEVVFGSGSVAESASADKVLVDHSTTIVESTRSMADELHERSGMVGWTPPFPADHPPPRQAPSPSWPAAATRMSRGLPR
jgi:3-hydroxyisobutyrate dehydrogenase-like beta-hydroxyacid dehydrogenase